MQHHLLVLFICPTNNIIRLYGSRSQLAHQVAPSGNQDLRNFDISLMRLLYSNKENPVLQSDSKEELDLHFSTMILKNLN